MAKFRKLAAVFCTVFFLAASIAGCGGGGSSGGITVTFSPVNSATDIAVDASVTATFSAAITEPADWSTVFTLILDGTGLPLCTTVTYDPATLVATCAHADFGIASDYTAAITGLTGVTDATTSFTTTSTPSVTGFSKDSVTALANGATNLYFTLNGALPLGATPTLTMSGGTAGACTVSADSVTLTCPVTGLAGCATFTDYTATLSGGITEYSVTFNSADDEFTSGDTIGNGCYSSLTNVTAANISDGTLTVAAVGERAQILKNVTAGKPDLVAVTYIDSFSSNSDGDLLAFLFKDMTDEHTSIYFGSLNFVSMLDPAQWLKVAEADDAQDMAIMNTSIWPSAAIVTQDLYFCIIHRSGLFNLYVSIDGDSYTQLTSDNMNCFDSPTCTLENIPTSAWTGFKAGFGSQNVSDENPADVTSQLSFTRFSLSPTTDGAADCANLTAY